MTVVDFAFYLFGITVVTAGSARMNLSSNCAQEPASMSAAQPGDAQDGVGRRAPRTLVPRQLAERCQDSLLSLMVDQRHHPLGEPERFEQAVGNLDLDVDQRVAHAVDVECHAGSSSEADFSRAVVSDVLESSAVLGRSVNRKVPLAVATSSPLSQRTSPVATTD